MFDVLISFVLSFRAYLRTQANNQLEILALRHQIVVLQRQNPKPKLKPADRRFWVALSQLWVPVAFSAVDCETACCDRLAPPQLSLVLDLEGSTWTALL